MATANRAVILTSSTLSRKETIMWVFDGEYWTDEASECGKEAPGMIAYLHRQELRPELQIQEIERSPGHIPNPRHRVSRTIKPSRKP